MNIDVKSVVIAKSEELFEKVVGYRQHLHQYPELSYQEYNTMKFISEQLSQIGIPHQTGVAETGIVALIKGKHHSENQPCIGLRADIDALPIQELNEIPFASKNQGVMHACGHDVHTSILLGVAEILWELRENLPHPVKLIFQPGEEKNPGGAGLMIKADCLSNPPVMKMYALHADPDIEVGKVGTKEGLFMASCDEIYIDIIGKGGHGARPQQAVDSILVGAEIVTSLQKIVSRNCDPNIPCVLTFGHFEGLGATNVIPERVHLKGTFRTMNERWRAEALERIQKQSELIAQAHGAEAKVEISHGYPFLENDVTTTREFIQNAQNWLGAENVIPNMEMRMGSEDFSFYAQVVPVCFFRIGVRNKHAQRISGLHTATFNIDNQSLKIGMQLMTMNCII
ncbi:MAG: amidohydrolase [Brumimicrobium sp.]|nr:amidohydrolase [Brumimicrobium sp.]